MPDTAVEDAAAALSTVINPIADALLTMSLGYRAATELSSTQLSRWREAMGVTLRKFHDIAMPALAHYGVSEAAAAAAPAGVDLRTTGWHQQPSFDAGRAVFHLEHYWPISALVGRLLAMTDRSEVVNLLQGDGLWVVWITKEEDKKLTAAGVSARRPDPEAAYAAAGITLAHRPTGAPPLPTSGPSTVGPLATWEPLVLPRSAPLQMLEPHTVPTPECWVLDPTLVRFLELGAGPMVMEIKWMWRWGADGVLRFFRSWTGFEVFRLTVVPATATPSVSGLPWRIVDLQVEMHRTRTSWAHPTQPLDDLRGLLDSLLPLSEWLSDLPLDRAAALRASAAENAPTPTDIPGSAASARLLVGRRLERLSLGDRELVPEWFPFLEVVEPDGEALRIEFSDGSTLWVHHPWRLRIDADGLTTDVGGALFWPGPAWASSLGGACAWAVDRKGQTELQELVRGADGEPLDAELIAPREPQMDDAVIAVAVSAL